MTDEQEQEYEALRDETIPDLIGKILALRNIGKQHRAQISRLQDTVMLLKGDSVATPEPTK